jgi:hypothetical protein
MIDTANSVVAQTSSRDVSLAAGFRVRDRFLTDGDVVANICHRDEAASADDYGDDAKSKKNDQANPLSPVEGLRLAHEGNRQEEDCNVSTRCKAVDSVAGTYLGPRRRCRWTS